MSKTSTDLARHALNGPTMGSRWSALFFAPAAFDPGPVAAALQAAVDRVEGQMSTWKPQSDLMRLNAAPVGEWHDLPEDLAQVLRLGLAIGRASGGAFDIATGDAVTAWGFGPAEAAPPAIRAAIAAPRRPAWDCLDLDGRRLLKRLPVTLDLNGIAKGYGVDRLAGVLAGFGITSALAGIDGEMRTLGLRPDGAPWAIAVEAPDPGRRAPHSVVSLHDAAIATSGDYRHWLTVGGRRLSHTMNPATGAPLGAPPASVTVVAPTCAEADAWATALMVLGPESGADCARRCGLDALILMREDGDGLRPRAVGRLFSAAA